MPIKPEQVELGKSYQANDGVARKVFEIVPQGRSRANEICDDDIIRFEIEKWGYDAAKFNGKTRVKVRAREKQKRADFIKDVIKQLD